MSTDDKNFQFIVRIQNTNIDGNRKVHSSLTMIKGVGRRFADMLCKKANVAPLKKAGHLTDDEIKNIDAVIANPTAYDIPLWMLNRRRDMQTGNDLHLVSTQIDNNLRQTMERIKKIRLHRGIRHHCGFKVRGQHTKSTGRKHKMVSGFKKKLKAKQQK